MAESRLVVVGDRDARRGSGRRRLGRFGAVVGLGAVVLLALPVGAVAAAPPPAVAPGAPGAASFFDLARKDCVGTARNSTSKVWFTVADGVLSDVYEPTIDNTNVKSLQYVVTDGSSLPTCRRAISRTRWRPIRPG
jgi:glucoamylase